MARGILVSLGLLLALISVISGFAFHKKSSFLNGHKKMLSLHNRIAGKNVIAAKNALALEQLKKTLHEKAKKQMSDCDSILSCLDSLNAVLTEVDPTSPEICSIANAAIAESQACLDEYQECSSYDQFKSILDMTSDSIEPLCGDSGMSCDMMGVEAAYTVCIEKLDEEFGHIISPAELCNELDNLAASLHSCFTQVQIEHPACEMFHEIYMSMVGEILNPIAAECSSGELQTNECDAEYFSPEFEECLAPLEKMEQSDTCKEAKKVMDDAVKCINKIGKNDTKWVEDCEEIRELSLQTLKPAQDILDQAC